LIPGGSGYFTNTQNMALVTTKFKSGGLHEKHVVALGNMGSTSAFAFRPRETMGVKHGPSCQGKKTGRGCQIIQ
jgi:hypothetical protein